MREDTDRYHDLFVNDVPLLDVRAPVEFAHGAFPLATNLPLLDVDSSTPGVDYPGGAANVFHAVAGNKVLVAWPSTA